MIDNEKKDEKKNDDPIKEAILECTPEFLSFFLEDGHQDFEYQYALEIINLNIFYLKNMRKKT
jgi:hypothetical protein